MYPQQPASPPPDNTPPPRPSPRATRRQAQTNVCMVIAITLLTMLLLSLLLVGGTIWILLTTTEQTSHTNQPQPPSTIPQQRTSSDAAALTPDTITRLTETRHIPLGNIGTAATAPDGTLIAIALGAEVIIYDPQTRDIVQTLNGHIHNINALAFSPPGKNHNNLWLAASAVDETAVLVWDITSGQQIAQLDGHTGWIRSIAFTPDGTLATASTDHTIKLWNVQRNELIHTLSGHTDMVSDIAISPDNRLLASTSRDGTVRLWTIATGQPHTPTSAPGGFYALPQENEQTPRGWTTGLAFSPDNTHLAVGATDNHIRILKIADGTIEQTLQGHTGLIVIRGLAYSSDGNHLASASVDGTARIWNSRTGATSQTLDHRGGRVLSVSWLPDNTTLATSSDTRGEVLLWDTQEATPNQRIPLAQAPIHTLAYAPDSTILATAGRNGTIRLHLLQTNRQITLADAAQTQQTLAFLSSHELTIANNDPTGSLTILDILRRSDAQTNPQPGGPMQSIAASTQRGWIAAASQPDEILLWDAHNAQPIHRLHTANGPATHLAFHHQGATLIASTTGASEQTASQLTIQIWNTTTGTISHTLTAHQQPITAIATRPGTSTLATTSQDSTLRLWNITNGTPIQTISTPTEQEWYTSIAYSPDGQLLVTGSTAGTLTFWNAETAEQIHQQHLGGNGVLAIAFRPDGKQLAVSLLDGGVKLFAVK